MKQRIFSGIQPSGNIHIGNYLGAIKNWVGLQEKYESIFCVVDLHAITVYQKPEELRKKIIEVAKIYLASGIDSKKSIIFIQSHIPQHCELTWLLNTLTKIPELERMTQFKDKAKEQKSSIGAGLLNYPILMAADILLYDTNLVPVGEDQLQHVELARTIAQRFNRIYGPTFKVPESFVVKETMRIMGLDNPLKKMSKSAESKYNDISLLDSPEKIQEKIKKAVTDNGREIKYSDKKPAIKNLINIYSSFSNKTPKEIEKLYQGKGYAEFKKDLAEVIIDFIKSFQNNYQQISDQEVKNILQQGAEQVRPLAQKKIIEVKEKMGLM